MCDIYMHTHQGFVFLLHTVFNTETFNYELIHICYLIVERLKEWIKDFIGYNEVWETVHKN